MAPFSRAGLLALALTAACAQEPVAINVRLVTKACATGKNPLGGVGTLKLMITGEGMKTIEKTAAVGDGTASLPLIPPGKSRRIQVEGVSDSSAATVSVGQSAFFDITGEEEAAIEVPVFLRLVDQFTPTDDLADPGRCTSMAGPRSGHTATLLNDGRVLVVGGFVDQETAPGSGIFTRTYLATAEVFDPKTGGFTQVGPLRSARAYHTATKLKDTGEVLIVGGEAEINSAPTPLQSAEMFDPKTNTFAKPVLLEGGARTRHTATQDAGGRIFFAGGGISLQSGNPEPEVVGFAITTAWWDPATKTFKIGPSLPKGRVDHAAVTLSTGHMMLIGGWDGTKRQDGTPDYLDTSLFFIFRDGQFRDVPDPALAAIRIAKRAALTAVRLPEEGANRVVVAGGLGDFGIPTQTAQFIDVLTADVETLSAQLAQQRAQHCMVALADGAVVVIGGRGKDTSTSPETSRVSADVIVRDPNSGNLILRPAPPGDMRDARYQHTCTVLQDGSVLVVGGVRLTLDGKRDMLASAEIYTPMLPAR